VSAWREMLIGRLLDKPESARLFEILEDEQAWLKSELSQVELSRHGQRCEAWFYEAMRAKAEQERERMVEYLRRCVGVGFESYYEHKMSLFLLSQMR